MKIEVWYSRDPLDMIGELTGKELPKDVSQHEMVAAMDLLPLPDEGWEEMADRVFRLMNNVDGDELCVELGVRSMSVGDIVRFGQTAEALSLLCMMMGWKEL